MLDISSMCDFIPASSWTKAHRPYSSMLILPPGKVAAQKTKLLNRIIMLLKLNRKRKGAFTLVEIMFVVAIIALLAAIAIPNFIRARKRAQASKILEDLRIIDAGIEQYAIDHNMKAGDALAFDDLTAYFKKDSALYTSGGKDMFGASYGDFKVDAIPTVPATTFTALKDVAPAEFWSPYIK